MTRIFLALPYMILLIISAHSSQKIISSLQDWILLLKPNWTYHLCVLISQVPYYVATLLIKPNSQFKLKLALGTDIKTKEDPKRAAFSSLLGSLALL